MSRQLYYFRGEPPSTTKYGDVQVPEGMTVQVFPTAPQPLP